MKKLFSCLAAIMALFSISSCLQEERSPEEILVPSPAQVDCSESSFSLTSKVPSGSEKLVDACGFLVGTTKDLADAVTVEGTLNANTFAADLPSRKYGTTYYICSYVTNGHGSEIKSQVSTFEMGDLDDYVSFGKVSLVSYNPLTKLAEINIPVEILSVVNVTEVGVCYGADESLSIDGTHAEGVISEDGILSVPLEGFTDGTQYYLRPYVSENDYIAYGEAVSFVIPSVPIVLTYPAEDVTSDSALLSGEVQRGEGITERGFVWLSGQGVPTIDSYKVKVDGTVGKFTASLNDLAANEKYAYRAYVVNNQGVFYGDIINFTTIAGLPSLSAMKVSDITMTSASFTCAVTGHGGDIVSEVGFYIGKEETIDLETALKISEAYTSDSFTFTATDLEVGTDYYVKAFAKNSVGESYSVIVSFKTVSTAPSVTTVGSSEITDSSVLLSGDVTDDNGDEVTERGFVWLKGTGTPTTSDYKIQSDGTTGEFTAVITDIVPNHTYSFRAYAINAKGTSYGETMSFMIEMSLPTVTTVGVTDITDNSAVSGGVIVDDGGGDIIAKGVVWSRSGNPTVEDSFKTEDGNGVDSFTSYLTDLTSGRTYYVRAYATNLVGTSYGEELQFTVAGELQAIHLQAANCFIISSPKVYSFKTVKGNSSESVGSVFSAEVLWESYGTSETPVVGSLVSSVSAQGDMIVFEVPEPYREGNAVIAAKDATGTILWSWHIWLTDQPQEQIYNNNAGTMMDRNLGATSATPGDVGALGLLYQWGRKDPFLGSSSISSDTEARSTITWPSPVSSDSSHGTIEYAISHPKTFIKWNYSNDDWYYTGSSSTDDTRWQSDKTIYDPCPSGWRVPDGGCNGVWNVAGFSDTTSDDTNKGISFSISSPSTTWYPASGFRSGDDGALYDVGYYDDYWSVTPYGTDAYTLFFNIDGNVYPTKYSYRPYGYPVRCFKEGTGGDTKYDNDFSTSGARNLSDEGTANSYIVSSAGTYSISPVKGNSSESIGSVASAEVLWETFGTDENVIKGNLISGARYENGRIYFKTADTYREGNAVVAAKDAAGTILWSWHIWLTDEPEGHVYNNNAGTMMDRNLGATSATPGDVGALGLLYQWGRKDPFLGSSSISSSIEAKSTITWPSAVSSDSSTGTVDFVTSHPTTFVKSGSTPYDWHYSSRDNTLWQSGKTIYDPCPVGWRVPDGGSNGVWKTAGFASTSYDSSNEGMSFSISSPSTTWYPASGCRSYYDGALYDVGSSGDYWSVTPYSDYAFYLDVTNFGDVWLTSNNYRANGFSVRCLQVTN